MIREISQSLIRLLENNLLQVQRTPDDASQPPIMLEATLRRNCLSHGTGHSGNLVSQSQPSTAQRDMLNTSDLTSKPTWSPHYSFLSDWTANVSVDN